MSDPTEATSEAKAEVPPTGTRTAEDAMPGDLSREDLLDRFIRVNQAGEYGAVRIYTGQMAVLGSNPTLKHMLDQEVHHLETFTRMIADRGGRPTVMQPLWHLAGFALGAGSALLGEKAAHACTVAVEEAIDEHYAAQRDALGDDESELRDTVEQFRLEELEHRDIGLQNGAEGAPAYPLLYGGIKAGTKLAIWISERI